MTPKLIPQLCAHLTCSNLGVIRVGDNFWVCPLHFTEFIHNADADSIKSPDDARVSDRSRYRILEDFFQDARRR